MEPTSREGGEKWGTRITRDGGTIRNLCGSRGDNPRRLPAAREDCGSGDGVRHPAAFLHRHHAVRRQSRRENLAGQLQHIPAVEAVLRRLDVDENIRPEREVTTRLSGQAISSCHVLVVVFDVRNDGATILGVNTSELEELLQSMRFRSVGLLKLNCNDWFHYYFSNQ